MCTFHQMKNGLCSIIMLNDTNIAKAILSYYLSVYITSLVYTQYVTVLYLVKRAHDNFHIFRFYSHRINLIILINLLVYIFIYLQFRSLKTSHFERYLNVFERY